jgi:hypothetical protein
VYRQTARPSWVEDEELTSRSTREVIEDHIRLQIAGQLEEDLQRNYAPDVVLLTEHARQVRGHDAVRRAASRLYGHGPGSCYELVGLEVYGDYGLLIWKADAAGYAVNCAADSFVVTDGKIRVQTSHQQLQEPTQSLR